jgi:putative DNA primase/helicase
VSVTLEDVRRLFPKAVGSGDGSVLVNCPCHDDRTPSLNFWIDEKGKLAHDCKAGCEWQTVHAELERRGLYSANGDGDRRPDNPAHYTDPKTKESLPIVEFYDYCSADGTYVYTVGRTAKNRDGVKNFPLWRRKSPGAFSWGYGDEKRRLLWHLPQLVAAVAAGKTVFIPAGEKDVRTVERLGFVATTNSGGESCRWRHENNEILRGADVVVLPDNDATGAKHAEDVVHNLTGVAKSVAVVNLPNLPDKGDVSDWAEAGGTAEQLLEVVRRAQGQTGEESSKQSHEGTPSSGVPEDGLGEPLVCEAAHTAVLADAWRGCYRWAQHEGSWRRWDGHVWEKVAEPVVVAAAQKALREHYGRCLAGDASRVEYDRLRTLHIAACRYASVAAGLAFLKGEPGFHTESDQWDADPYLLNCADGLLDLRTQKMRPHDPTALCTKTMRWSYADETSTGAWQRHLERCLPSADVRRQVQRDLGRALVGADLEESLPIWFGTGANGKSTTERAIQQGADGYGKKAARNLLVASKFERHPTEIADLAGARLVFSEEVEDGKQLAEALVKDLTGGATQKARFMRCDNFEFEQTFSIFLLVNHRPVITGTDKGIWRRIRLVPWTVAIPLAEQRPQDEVVAELLADGSWMLRWMVAGFADWQADHHWLADEVKVATDAYRAEQDRLAGFLAEVCEEKRFAEVSAADLHAAHGSWCIAEGEESLSKTALGKALKSRGFTSKRASGGTHMWQGIRLRVTRSDTFPGSSLENASRENEAENTSLRVTKADEEVFF